MLLVVSPPKPVLSASLSSINFVVATCTGYRVVLHTDVCQAIEASLSVAPSFVITLSCGLLSFAFSAKLYMCQVSHPAKNEMKNCN
jgi:hypothetical protein